MGYTALLFCPEEKTARTVTQVLSELEFTVEACIEPFAAVKKLMGQHFDAVVVDCDNEQNATLLFKSARNSASNQTSLAVAVVEGQAGVAKAFRIGANLVLTKPINIEQAKGTLRVARGLLRKAEPAKGTGASAASVAAAEAAPAAKSAAGKVQNPNFSQKQGEAGHPVEEPKPAATPAVFAAQAEDVPLVKPTPAWSDAAVASALASASAQADDDLLGIEEEAKADAKPKPAPGAPPAGSPILPNEIFATRAEAKPALLGVPQASPSAGAASAAAPAREIKEISAPKKLASSTADDDVLDTSSPPPAIVGSAPSFTFGGASAASESSGGGKKIFIGIAAAAVVAAGLYFGWTHFHGSAGQPGDSEPAVSTPASVTTTPTPKLNTTQPLLAKPSPAPVSATPAGGATPSEEPSHTTKTTVESGSVSKPESTKPPAADVKDSTEDTPEPAPLMVKSGKAPATKNAAASDAEAPSVIGLAPGDAAPLPALGTTTDTAAFKPTLQTLNVSQGVSQGLLIKKVSPSYPPSALRMRVEGKVELLATISKDGNITHIKVLSGDSQLTKAATDAVSKWKYQPYLLNGEPVEIQTQVTVNFKLPTQ